MSTEVVLDFKAPRGELELTVIDRNCQPVGGASVQVEPVLPHGVPVSSGPSLGTGLVTPAAATELPPGEYTVDIMSSYDWGRFLLSKHRVIRIEAGQTRRLEVQLRSGGRFRLMLHATPTLDSAPPHEAIVRVAARDGETRKFLSFLREAPDGSHPHLGCYSFSKEPELSSLLESGPHVLSIEVKGFESVERVLQIAPEHIADLEITLIPR